MCPFDYVFLSDFLLKSLPERCREGLVRASSVCWQEVWPASWRFGFEVGHLGICWPWCIIGLIIGASLTFLFCTCCCSCFTLCAVRSGRFAYVHPIRKKEARALQNQETEPEIAIQYLTPGNANNLPPPPTPRVSEVEFQQQQQQQQQVAPPLRVIQEVRQTSSPSSSSSGPAFLPQSPVFDPERADFNFGRTRRRKVQ